MNTEVRVLKYFFWPLESLFHHVQAGPYGARQRTSSSSHTEQNIPGGVGEEMWALARAFYNLM